MGTNYLAKVVQDLVLWSGIPLSVFEYGNCATVYCA